jgi:hypothetical protein
MATIPATEPTEIRAGDSILWTRDDLTADYPAPTWTLNYYLVNSAKQYTILAVADGDSFDITVPKATSALYTPGTYTMTGVVSTATEQFTIKTTTIEILPNLSAATAGYDTRTHAKIMLEALDSILEGKATNKDLDLVAKSFGDKAITRNPELLLKWRNYYEAKVASEQTKEGSSSGSSKIRVKFTQVT